MKNVTNLSGKGMLVACLLVFATSLSAEQMDKVEREKAIDASTAIIKSERESFVSGTMKLTEKEQKVFWPIYTEYRGDREKLTDRAVALVTEYMNHYDQISNEKAESMLEEFLNIREGL